MGAYLINPGKNATIACQTVAQAKKYSSLMSHTSVSLRYEVTLQLFKTQLGLVVIQNLFRKTYVIMYLPHRQKIGFWKTWCLTSPLSSRFLPPFLLQTNRGCDTHRKGHPPAMLWVLSFWKIWFWHWTSPMKGPFSFRFLNFQGIQPRVKIPCEACPSATSRTVPLSLCPNTGSSAWTLSPFLNIFADCENAKQNHD